MATTHPKLTISSLLIFLISTTFHINVVATIVETVPEIIPDSVDNSIWSEIVEGFAIEERNDSRIQEHILWFKKNPEYLTRSLNRSKPYLYHIVKEAKRRKMPLELALLPVVESAFQTHAYSPGNAAGLWQFIPATGKAYGLEQSWWIDERYSPLKATNSALYFLTDMARTFDGDWMLALSAYNAGAGNVRKAIRKFREAEEAKNKIKDKNSKTNNRDLKVKFWDLDLPTETKKYVPRLLALAHFIERADEYNFSLPEIPNRELTTTTTLREQLDIASIADYSGLPLKDIYQFNAGLNQWATPPKERFKLLLPTTHVNKFRDNLKKRGAGSRTLWIRHLIKSGDTLGAIALKYKSSVQLIKNQNRIKDDKIVAGKKLTIPIPLRSLKRYTHPTPTKVRPTFLTKMASQTIRYRVRKGDTLSEIAHRFNIPTRELMKQNRLILGDILNIDDKLNIHLDPKKHKQ
ncbi:MAG: transglycosylase SLT domain-containing protein [Thiotrichales bacterium]|jgi:membrane-bound lytic murein transglycosylase D|nr:transglycosylase SLT domain-containing protein [Thiotrichales bacterium]MBT3612909.1 transglycosylase SLT domain-containing protein [Thiotrichales bacterium]MBT3752320.1 transglycosylase SLT domain-containing protein [Thiotrichales bacterium]MBT3837072.1 transglycosylase SLT domain-containing protein [Thiotrichales bacterium]MBT4152491.1 transglycosylase SLT domain-containing protein [Thiotrichales bacterium]